MRCPRLNDWQMRGGEGEKRLADKLDKRQRQRFKDLNSFCVHKWEKGVVKEHPISGNLLLELQKEWAPILLHHKKWGFLSVCRGSSSARLNWEMLNWEHLVLLLLLEVSIEELSWWVFSGKNWLIRWCTLLCRAASFVNCLQECSCSSVSV